jgi:signal transduction histidine kinase
MREDIPLAAAGLAVATSPCGPAQPHAWDGSMRRWDGYAAVILAATLFVSLVTAAPRDRAGCAAALLAMAGWYVLVGRAAVADGHDDELGLRAWRGPVYLAGLVVLLAVAVSYAGESAFILLVLCPHCFMAEPFRRAVVPVVALNLTPAIVEVAKRQPAVNLAIDAGIAVAGIAFSVVFGGWVMRIIGQSSERAELIGQLEATRTELAAANREAGVLAERQRLSADIHDTIAQGFASIVMLLQAAESSLRTNPDGASYHLQLATQTARDSLAEARVLVAGLTPAQLDGGSLDDALRRVAAQARSQGGIAAEVEVTGAVRPLATSAEVMLLRVCQEALSNVRKHARASQACVRLAYDAAEVRLAVSDDGAGFDPAAENDGYGLRGMRARVAEAGGALSVRSAPGAGTAVSVTVPA